jgi:hypothetical protein
MAASARNDLIKQLQREGRLKELEPILREVLAEKVEEFGEEHPETLKSMNSLARLYQVQGRMREALPLYEKTLAGRRKTLGNL